MLPLPRFLPRSVPPLAQQPLCGALTKSEPLPGDLPLRGVVGQVFTLLIQRHLARVHNDGQIACLDVRGIDLKGGRRGAGPYVGEGGRTRRKEISKKPGKGIQHFSYLKYYSDANGVQAQTHAH